MVSVNLKPAQGFFYFDPMNMGLPGLKSLPPAYTVAPPPPPTSMSMSSAGHMTSYLEDSSKKIRKPYTITKSRERWTEQKHDKFLEALQLSFYFGQVCCFTLTLDAHFLAHDGGDVIFFITLIIFDPAWKKIEAFVGSKTVIQIRSHAQKYFLKAQKNGTDEHVPPPRPKSCSCTPSCWTISIFTCLA